jgi:hypothetical protein
MRVRGSCLEGFVDAVSPAEGRQRACETADFGAKACPEAGPEYYAVILREEEVGELALVPMEDEAIVS